MPLVLLNAPFPPPVSHWHSVPVVGVVWVVGSVVTLVIPGFVVGLVVSCPGVVVGVMVVDSVVTVVDCSGWPVVIVVVAPVLAVL